MRWETASLLFLIWSIHAVIGMALSAPVLFLGRKRIGLAFWMLLALVIPFCIWILLMFSPLSIGRKSLANMGEVAYVSFAMPALALFRVALGKRISERIYAVSFITILCGIAVAVFFLVPMLPE
jgi:hypothetical protein